MVKSEWRESFFRRGFVKLSPIMDARGGDAHRAHLLGAVSGTVVEVGAGTGTSFRHYGAAVDSVVAVEPDAELRAIAETAARSADATITVTDGTAETLPVASGSCDWVVCSLVLCTVPDQRAAFAEFARVLRPGGRLAFYEHVRSNHPVIATMQDALTPAWSALAGGCHPNRDTLAAITSAGFEIESVDRFGFSPHPAAPAFAHISGTARLGSA
ncbi:methyltransferase domain-containing protein [Salinibacterium sp. G-O1]|uniref:class I SAM-dependent methyltransferase n=1 Tax=Salinibacterium sp. G-O1 TaxID=3046208 RepID=UPI0024BBB25A|nr:class I SAM-dependent methyltransferase [Salinibacterium sp. G-O1]MDJ0336052.1 methyltransferase domain-containing protein [Salinibacterium sp. G-O1]